jgi:hypothetical protein
LRGSGESGGFVEWRELDVIFWKSMEREREREVKATLTEFRYSDKRRSCIAAIHVHSLKTIFPMRTSHAIA